jgi:hypothetical protein
MDHKQQLWLQGLSEGRVMRCKSRGKSMFPFLREGDLVDLVATQEFRIGDIVLAQEVLHRVVAKRNGQIITKGDANSHLDPPVARAQILGRVVARERRGRVRQLDSLEARFLGLAFSFTVAMRRGLIYWLVRLRNGAGKALGRSLPVMGP